jgi:hypothetical protein
MKTFVIEHRLKNWEEVGCRNLNYFSNRYWLPWRNDCVYVYKYLLHKNLLKNRRHLCKELEWVVFCAGLLSVFSKLRFDSGSNWAIKKWGMVGVPVYYWMTTINNTEILIKWLTCVYALPYCTCACLTASQRTVWKTNSYHSAVTFRQFSRRKKKVLDLSNVL